MTEEPVRILLADDHPAFLAGLEALLATVAGVVAVGRAGSGEAAVAAAAELQPDVVLMDLNMPGIDGIEATRRIVATSPHIAVIVLSMYENDDQVFGALKAGARGYLLKGVPRAEIFTAIRVVHAGGSLLQPVVATRVLEHVASRGRGGTSSPDEIALTPRETSVLQLLARGRSNKQIAAALGVSERTVKFHVSALFTKLGATNRTEAVTRAIQAGLTTL